MATLTPPVRRARSPRAAHATVAQSLLGALRAAGVTEIFGIPGDFALPLFDAIEAQSELPLYTLSHEPSVAFAADASARVRAAPGCVAVTYGAGALNIVNAVAAAYAEKSPVVVLSGAPAASQRASGLGVHHQAKTLDSQMAIFREITCDQACLDDPARAPRDVARVLASLAAYSRPVYLEIPRDVVARPCPPIPAVAPDPGDAEAIDACAEEILARLSSAKQPVLMVGVEVRRFGLEAEVAALARTLRLPVVTSFMGRGLLNATGVALAGTYAGNAGDPEVADLVESSDALFLLGVIVSDTNFAVSRRRVDLRRAIQALDGRVALAHHTYFDVPLGALVRSLRARAKPIGPAPEATARKAVPEPRLPAAPLSPLHIAHAINEAMAVHGPFPLAADVGDSLFTAMSVAPTDYVAPGYYATMGFGVPAAIGLQVATGRRPIAIVGDGAFQMTGLELGHCTRLGLDPIVIVLNNGTWGMLAAYRPHARYTHLGQWDLAACANSLGGRGVRVGTPAELARALDQAARNRGRFQLIDVRLAPDAMSPALRRFTAATLLP